MGASDTTSGPVFGFLTALDLAEQVWIGGYLILNALGRPIEFHCTEPVKPNRAQQILYGATLEPFLCGEQIGRALVKNAKAQTDLILTDLQSVLALADFCEVPVVCVGHSPDTKHNPSLICVSVKEAEVYLHASCSQDQSSVQRVLGQADLYWDLSEPFDRIRDAISELQKAA